MVKIERSFPPPKSLAIEEKKAAGSYSQPDVTERLKHDFHNKCYICGMKDLQDPVVEHLLPHKNGFYQNRKFDWENLFWACGHCNLIKSRGEYDAGILNCCRVDPEEMLDFRLQEKVVQVLVKVEDEKADRTASLVKDVFTLKNTGMRVYKSDLRFKLLVAEMNKLYDNLEEWKNHPDSRMAERKLKALLRRESPFSAFKRGYVRERAGLFPQLQEFLV